MPKRTQTSPGQRWLAAVALVVFIGGSVWLVGRQTVAVMDAVSGGPEDVQDTARADGPALRPEPPIASGSPAQTIGSLGSMLPSEGKTPLIDVDRQRLRVPTGEDEDGIQYTEVDIPSPFASPEAAVEAFRLDPLSGSDTVALTRGCGAPPSEIVEMADIVDAWRVALLDEIQHNQDLQSLATSMADESHAASAAETVLRASAEAACESEELSALAWYAAATLDPDATRDPIDKVADILKGMKPKPAAKVAEGWERDFAARVLARISARSAAKVLAAMSPPKAGQVSEAMLARLAFQESDPTDPTQER